MRIEWNGRTWDFDAEEVTMKQAFVIKDSTKDDVYPAGRSLGAWNRGLNDAEPSCVRAAYWLMFQQAELPCPIGDLEFSVVKFNNALVTAAAAEQKAEEEREKAEEKAEAERQAALAVPTRAASPTSGSPPGTTPGPQPESVRFSPAASPTAT
jgi:hypothetical protein